ncbi:hypothetical protein U9D55_003917 [Enterobacter roggenkampii]|nr:hypothetical protein [Enterobacter roggenkampii]
MTKMLLPLIRDAGRFALYTFVFGPALLLYGIVIAISLEGSLAGQFVKEAQTLTEGAPAGKVMQCVTHHEAAPQPRLPESGEDASPPPYEFPPVQFCHREPVDSELWIKPMNATLLNLWLMGALFGAAVAFLAHLYIHRSTTSRQMPGVWQKEKHE